MLSIKKVKCFVKQIQHFLVYRTVNNVSSRKFHQLAEKMDKDQIIHSLHEDNIITKYLKGENGKSSNQQNQYHRANQLSNKQQLQPKAVNYQQILTRSPRGSVLNKDYKSSQLCLFGMNYTHTSYDTLYKAILKFQPDCVLVQNRPEVFLSQFDELKKDPITSVFSDRLYVEQLNVIRDEKIKGQFISQEGKNKLSERIFPRKSMINKVCNTMTQNSKFMLPNLENDLVQQKPLIASIYYSLHHNNNQHLSNNNTLPIYLSQLPQRTQRQWLANSNTLMQLQQIFKQACKSLPLYPGTNITPYQLACYMFPQQFMGVNDKYMATMVEIMLALGYKRIMMFCPVGGNQAVWEILQNNMHCDEQGNINPIIHSLIPPQVKGSLIRNIDSLELIQKHILLDSLFYGYKLINTPVIKFKTTNQIMDHYAKQEPKEMLFKFRYEMCMKYSEMMGECVREGEERKRKQFMRTVMRQ